MASFGEKGENNALPGLRAENLSVIPDEQVTGLIQPILDHLRSVVCRSEEEFQFLLAWLARPLQHPAHKSGVALVLISDQGVGKDIIPTWFINFLLGTDVGMQTANVSHIFGEHSTALQHKVLCVFDETDPATLKPHMSNLKAMMTSETIHVQPMCKSPYTVPNTFNFMITTNDKNPFPLVPSDPRFVVFECNDSKKGDFAYFENLAKNLNDRTARAFYQFLLGFDLSDYGCFMAKRPETQWDRRQLKDTDLSAFHSFLSYECIRCAGWAPEPCEMAMMFQRFKQWAGEWAGDAGFDVRCYTTTKFGTDFNTLMKMVESNVVCAKRTAKGRVYIINWTKLQSYLKLVGLFTSEEEETRGPSARHEEGEGRCA